MDALAVHLAGLPADAVRRMLRVARPVVPETEWDREYAALSDHMRALAQEHDAVAPLRPDRLR